MAVVLVQLPVWSVAVSVYTVVCVGVTVMDLFEAIAVPAFAGSPAVAPAGSAVHEKNGMGVPFKVTLSTAHHDVLKMTVEL